jgi:hypothetical protein
MTREEAIASLKKIHEEYGADVESDHLFADEILCELLISLGYEDVVFEWEKIDKWYA